LLAQKIWRVMSSVVFAGFPKPFTVIGPERVTVQSWPSIPSAQGPDGPKLVMVPWLARESRENRTARLHLSSTQFH
jgi:hypothetical protein